MPQPGFRPVCLRRGVSCCAQCRGTVVRRGRRVVWRLLGRPAGICAGSAGTFRQGRFFPGFFPRLPGIPVSAVAPTPCAPPWPPEATEYPPLSIYAPFLPPSCQVLAMIRSCLLDSSLPHPGSLCPRHFRSLQRASKAGTLYTSCLRGSNRGQSRALGGTLREAWAGLGAG